MKFSIFATLAATVAALPSTSPNEKRTGIDAGKLNQLLCKQTDLNYLLGVNKIDLGLFQKIGIHNHFDVLQFQSLFTTQTFDIVSLLRMQQLHTLLVVAQTGVFNNFDLATLQLGSLDLALINNIGGIGLSQFIDVAVVPQIQTISSSGKLLTSDPRLRYPLTRYSHHYHHRLRCGACTKAGIKRFSISFVMSSNPGFAIFPLLIVFHQVIIPAKFLLLQISPLRFSEE